MSEKLLAAAALALIAVCAFMFAVSVAAIIDPAGAALLDRSRSGQPESRVSNSTFAAFSLVGLLIGSGSLLRLRKHVRRGDTT